LNRHQGHSAAQDLEYLRAEGRLVPGGGADVNTDAILDWGTISIQLDSCFEGEFSAESSLPQFGSGSFYLDRLGLVNDLGCSDGDLESQPLNNP
jgi:hypothetical protein